MRILIFIALLCVAAQGKGQIYINSYRFASAQNLILDDYPSAEVAFSLRKLDADYTGNCIMVRRKSDGDSLAIGFSGNYVDTAALKTFCGTGATDSCWVRVWYDQSGNSKNARQITNASQPLIIIGGAIVYRAFAGESKPTIRFNSANHLNLDVTSAKDRSNIFYQVVFHSISKTLSYNLIFGYATGTTGNARAQIYARSTDVFEAGGRRLDGDSYQGVESTGSFTSGLGGAFFNYANAKLFIYTNGTEKERSGAFQTTGNTSNTNSIQGGSTIGSNLDNGNHVIQISEILFWASDQTSNRTGIQNNINTFYSIY